MLSGVHSPEAAAQLPQRWGIPGSDEAGKQLLLLTIEEVKDWGGRILPAPSHIEITITYQIEIFPVPNPQSIFL